MDCCDASKQEVTLDETLSQEMLANKDIKKYKEAWSQPGAMTAMINWYHAVVHYQHQPGITNDMRVLVLTLMMWGMKDFALSHPMARPGMDYGDNGMLLFSPETTYWLPHEEADEVNRDLLEFVLNR